MFLYFMFYIFLSGSGGGEGSKVEGISGGGWRSWAEVKRDGRDRIPEA